MNITKRLLIAALLLPSLALAEGTRVAVVDPIRAIGETIEVKNRTASMEVELKEQEGKLRKLGEEIRGIEEKLKKDSMTMSKDQQRELTAQREAKMFEFQSMKQTAQEGFQEDQQELLELMSPKLELAITSIAADNGYDVVLNRQAALFVNDAIDITRDVTQKINSMKK